MEEILDEISDKIFLEKLKNEFKESVKGYIADLREYHTAGQYQEIQKIAHDIKGIAGVFGYNRGTEIALELLNYIDAGDKVRTLETNSQLIMYLERDILEINVGGK